MAPQPQQRQEPRILRIFISYASEDLNIALAIARGLNDTLPETFVEVCVDKWFLQAGEEFKKQLESKLEKTDILIIIYTGVGKQSHSFTGWEVGFFDRVRKNDPTRRVVPFFLESLPASAAEFQGCSLKISPELLQLTTDEFSARNAIDPDDPICHFIRGLQDQARQIKEDAGYPKDGHEKCEPAVCVRNMRLAVFSYLKTTVEAIVKPQKQITLKTTGTALQQSETDLPANAKLVPAGGSPMSIFGLSDEEMTWERFLALTAGPHQDSWREAITSVIISSQAERIDVDNSQVILSSDETKTYRIVLTTATKYWNDNREFNLYFVETLKREDYGDHNTTLMLKGLEVVCRYRFMFLEDDSQFSAGALISTADERFPELAAKLLRELNMMRKESSSAGLDQPRYWKQFMDWGPIRDMGEAFRPRERKIRELISRALTARDQKLPVTALKEQLAAAVSDLEDATRSHNASLVLAMAKKLQAMVQSTAAPRD